MRIRTVPPTPAAWIRYAASECRPALVAARHKTPALERTRRASRQPSNASPRACPAIFQAACVGRARTSWACRRVVALCDSAARASTADRASPAPCRRPCDPELRCRCGGRAAHDPCGLQQPRGAIAQLPGLDAHGRARTCSAGATARAKACRRARQRHRLGQRAVPGRQRLLEGGAPRLPRAETGRHGPVHDAPVAQRHQVVHCQEHRERVVAGHGRRRSSVRAASRWRTACCP